MAEFLWTFAVQEVLKKIVQLGAEQIGLAWGMEKELPQLRKWLLKAETILADINRKKLHHASVRLWVEDLQDIVYEADDLLDELVYEHLGRTVKQTGKFRKVRDYSFSPFKNPFLFRYKMAKKMKNITQTLNKHYLEANTLGLVSDESTTETEDALKQIRETTSNLDFEVVGREIEVLELLKLVIDSTNEQDMSVISIVGMGGLGKTTLAKMVFNHNVIKQHFDKTIWVCVSKPFVIINILEGIFQGLTNTCSGLNSKEALLHRLQEEMQGKKYFLVLDDVWDKEINGLWDELSGCLKQIIGKSGISIMVTTRNVEVATMVKTVSIHHLKKLSDDECWILFKENANASELSMNSKLEIVKNVLVRKMGGVPLVAKVLGGALKYEQPFEEGNYERWMTKVESIARNISKEDKDFVLSILKLSVDSLPLLGLKQCFAFCSNFSQDYNFEKEKLIQMWIAQGFIQPQQERDQNLIMEDIGEEYFNILLSRSLFQDVIKDKNGIIVAFKMHDLIHDIACMISNHHKMESNPNNWSRISARKMRTLICDSKEIHNKVEDFVCLRVLVLDRFWTLPILMDKLIHLRYLDISGCCINQLKLFHESLSVLYNLQTLKLGNIESGLLKMNLRNLVNLRHLEFYKIHDIKQMPSYMGKLIHLQTLSEFAVGFEKGCKIEELGHLKNLKGTLKLTNLEKVHSREEAMAAKLVEKKNLRHLFFQWTLFYELGGEYDKYNSIEALEGLQPHKNLQSLNINGFRGEVLPNSIFVENLVEIHLFQCKRCEVLPMLGQLPSLKELEISFMDSVRSIGNEFYGIDSNQRNSFAFPQLKELYINGMKNLEQWDDHELSSNLFGSLKKLSVFGCDKLTKLPSGLESCHSIEYLVIHLCTNLMLNVQNLHNLYHLGISGLKMLPEGLAELTNLKVLMITGYMQNYEFSPFIDLSSQLVELRLIDDGLTDNATTQLPQQLQHLTNLQVLKIANFDGIEAVPEWLGSLTCLRTLGFSKCKNLKELPSREAIQCLTKLERLVVFRCPQLLLGEDDQEGAKLSQLPTKFVSKM